MPRGHHAPAHRDCTRQGDLGVCGLPLLVCGRTRASGSSSGWGYPCSPFAERQETADLRVDRPLSFAEGSGAHHGRTYLCGVPRTSKDEARPVETAGRCASSSRHRRRSSAGRRTRRRDPAGRRGQRQRGAPSTSGRYDQPVGRQVHGPLVDTDTGRRTRQPATSIDDTMPWASWPSIPHTSR